MVLILSKTDKLKKRFVFDKKFNQKLSKTGFFLIFLFFIFLCYNYIEDHRCTHLATVHRTINISYLIHDILTERKLKTCGLSFKIVIVAVFCFFKKFVTITMNVGDKLNISI